MKASRFPNKPMVKILGIPMVAHCFERSLLAKLVDEVYVATCDKEIFDFFKSHNGKVVMTKDTHNRASERTHEALHLIESIEKKTYDIIVMIQGDEPTINPNMIDEVVKPLVDENKNLVSNLMVKLSDLEDIINPNNVKVVTSKSNNALYFSREPIPSGGLEKDNIFYFRQLGLIAFRRKSLIDFESLKPSILEISESIDMNRYLENDYPVYMMESKLNSKCVDVPEDLEGVINDMRKDPYLKNYITKYESQSL